MREYWFIKPYDSNITATLYINGNPNDRSGTNYQTILTLTDSYREFIFSTSTLPTGKRLVRPGGPGVKYYRSVGVQTPSSSTNVSYTTAINQLNEIIASGAVTEIDFNEFSTAFNMAVTDVSDSVAKFTYTTPSADNPYYSYFMVFPESYYYDNVIYHSYTASATDCTITPSTGSFEDGSTINVTITPNTGYTLNTPTVTGATITWEQVGDTLQGSFTIEDDVTITATATAIPCTLTTTGQHCTFSPSTYTAGYGTTFTLKITPDSGYELTEASQISVTGATVAWSFTDGTATGRITFTEDVTVTATPSKIVVRYSLTATGSGCTISPSSGTYEEGTQITIRATANTGYSFKDSAPTTTGSVIWEKVNGEWIGEAVFLSDITIEATAYRVSSVTYNLTDATATPDQGTVYMYGDTVDITVTADAGMYFDTAPFIRYQDNYLNWYNVTLTAVDATSQYKRVYSFTKTIDVVANNFRNATLIATAQAIPLIEDFGVFNIYNPTLEQLKAIADKRYSYTENTEYYIDKVDLGNYVLSLLRVYVPFTKGPDATVMLGGYSTDVQAKSVIYPYATIECGSVTIPLVYDSEMDYNYSSIRMFIPFYGFTDLPTDRYMGKTITLVYECELITGKAIAQLIVNNEVLDIFDCRIATEVPYILSLDKGIHGNYDINTFALIDTVPFIEVYRNMEYSTDEIRGKNNTYKLISTLSGYQELNIVPVGIGATATEVSRIVALCREGVIL